MDKHKIVNQMKLYGEDQTVQLVQTTHRIRIIEAADIVNGMRVLEVGCGQGDTTAVIAEKVGPTGFVKGIDVADGSYGAPITLQQATDHLKNGLYKERIDIQLNTNLLTMSDEETYDVVIFSHCIWYMDSEQTLVELIKKATTLAPTIIVADWDIINVDEQQMAHRQAALIQALYATQNKSEANIRTLFTAKQVKEIFEKNNFEVDYILSIDAKDLQDGEWEIAEVNHMQFSTEFQSIVPTMKEMMNTTNEPQYTMDTFMIRATLKQK